MPRARRPWAQLRECGREVRQRLGTALYSDLRNSVSIKTMINQEGKSPSNPPARFFAALSGPGKELPTSGLPARLWGAVPLPLFCSLVLVTFEVNLILMRPRVPSPFSSPEPAASFSLPEPAGFLWRGLEALGWSALGARFEAEGLRELARFGLELFFSEPAVACCGGGEVGLEEACSDWGTLCCFFTFLRADSVPLASERLGEPGRFSLLALVFLDASGALPGRCEGVLLPFVDAPDGGFEAPALSISDFFSSSFLRSSSFRRSVSESSDSDYDLLAN